MKKQEDLRPGHHYPGTNIKPFAEMDVSLSGALRKMQFKLKTLRQKYL